MFDPTPLILLSGIGILVRGSAAHGTADDVTAMSSGLSRPALGDLPIFQKKPLLPTCRRGRSSTREEVMKDKVSTASWEV